MDLAAPLACSPYRRKICEHLPIRDLLGIARASRFLPLDLAQPGSLFAALDPGHAVSALFAVILMSLGLAAIVYRAKRRFAMLEPGSALMLVAYALGLWLLYSQAAG